MPISLSSQNRRTLTPAAAEVQPLEEYVAANAFLDEATTRATELPDGRLKPAPEDAELVEKLSSKMRNCCGQYALTTVCRAHGSELSLGEAIERTNPLRIFTGPYEMTGFLRKNGIDAKEHNKSSEEAIFNHVSGGRMALLLVNSEAENGGTCPHWVVVSGVTEDAQGQRTWTISDAAKMSGSDTFVGEISNASLMKAWKSPLGGFSGLSGFENYWIGVDEKPGMFGRPLRTAMASSSAHLVNQVAKGVGKGASFSRAVVERFAGGVEQEHDLASLRFPTER